MDIKTVAKFAEIIDKYGLTKIDITGHFRPIPARKRMRFPVQAAAAVPSPTPAAPADESAAEEPRSVNGTVQKSSLVGTVYLAPQEGRDPFSVGSEVKKGRYRMHNRIHEDAQRNSRGLTAGSPPSFVS